jgi:hypothetical protein
MIQKYRRFITVSLVDINVIAQQEEVPRGLGVVAKNHHGHSQIPTRTEESSGKFCSLEHRAEKTPADTH